MSIERALIARAQPYMVATRAKALIREEISKGCQPEISPLPVSLEPNFRPLWDTEKDFETNHGNPWTAEFPPPSEEWVRLHVWISPKQELDWNRSELFLKQLQPMFFRSGFEVAGNNKDVVIALFVHRSDLPIITAAFQGEFEWCELTIIDKGPLSGLSDKQWAKALFRDYFPYPPYSHLLTRPPELRISPLMSLTRVISSIESPAVGFYQTLFQAVRPENNWHRNVEILLDFEFTIKLNSGFQIPQKFAQQAPSGDLRQMAGDVENKAHNDKPFFAMALRIAAIAEGAKGKDILSSLSTFPSLFQHGGRPLRYVTENEYKSVLSPQQIRDMFILGLTHRPGFLVNSWELAGPVHVPQLHIDEQRPLPIQILEKLAIPNPTLSMGNWIGTSDYAGNRTRVCISPEIEARHTRLIGSTAVGKSELLVHMILGDIEQGHGVVVLDPHGDLVERTLYFIPERYVEKTIYLNPGDPEWVPIWNPLNRTPGQDIGRTTDDIVTAIQSFVSSGGWGDRLETILRNIIFSMILLPQATFLDISDLLRNKAEENEVLRREILKVVPNETVRQFWEHDYKNYGKDDLGPPKNKLSKLLVSDTVSLMLSQPESRFSFRRIMDEGMILLVNLSTLGSIKEILGNFIFTFLYLAALGRSDLPKSDRKQFHIHCDEAHKFMTDNMEDLIAETRKYGVSLNLAHQYLKQFGQKKIDAFSSMGSTIIFNVNSEDARHLIKDLQGKVEVDDITSLELYHAIARIGNEIVKFETRPPLPIPNPNFRDLIIEESRKKYYKPAHEVQEWIRRRNDRWHQPFSPLVPGPTKGSGSPIEKLTYDEF